MIPIEKEYFSKYTFVFSSYFVLYFYLKESLGKESNFHRAKKRISITLVKKNTRYKLYARP
ncbi:uncharacterized protein DS421_1g17360 [Arachis hypogaea]|nr:uncharacterized protein DS421_1g17360 [Arachis hypogaea]